ncbi:MAG: tetratricopeptide repeat protein [Cytophagaceae bacterium]
MHLFLLANIFLSILEFFNRTSNINAHISDAEKAFAEHDYKQVIFHYQELEKKFRITDDNIQFNLAQSYYYTGDTASCRKIYKKLAAGDKKKLSSTANQQLGNLAWFANRKNEAVNYYIQALKSDPDNQIARENLEIVKKLLKKDFQNAKMNTGITRNNLDNQSQLAATGETGESDPSGKTQESSGGSNSQGNYKANNQSQSSSQGTGDDHKGDENELKQDWDGSKETDGLKANKLKEIQMNEQRAKLILEAMKNSEVQYLQQKKIYRPGGKTDKPDW